MNKFMTKIEDILEDVGMSVHTYDELIQAIKDYGAREHSLGFRSGADIEEFFEDETPNE